jgi:hypothetical protein
MSYPTLFTTPGVRDFAEAVDLERQAQLAKWGDQHHPDGTGHDRVWAFTGPASYVAACARQQTEDLAADGYATWTDIALEEFAEAIAESDPVKLRAELVQVAAVCAAWIADLDSRPIVLVHASPQDGSGLTPCCQHTPFELLRTERMTDDPAAVTCTAGAKRP